MPQPKKPAAAKKPVAAKKATAAKRAPAKKTPAKKTPAKKTPAKKTPAKKTAAKKPAAKKPAKGAPPRPRAAKAAKAAPRVKPKAADRRSKRTSVARTKTEAARDVALFDNLAAIRDALAEHLLLSAERLQETIDDAVRRGRMLPTDAQDLADRLRSSGRRQVEELLSDLDRRLGR